MSQAFGRYTVVGQLGKGAMGVVYLASDPLLNRQVAVKTVELASDDPQERAFLRERLMRDARAAAVLKHPNIVGVHDFFEEGERAYVVMEYVEGESLAARLKANPLPETPMILRVLRQMADALDYTHARGVIHRDIKPANVMIDIAGDAKIMDFGIARITDTRTCTPTGMVMGTVEYMAPEQIRGETLDGRADQFALAVVAYQMMTGTTLFGPHGVATLTYKIVNETAPPPRTRNAALPLGVDAVLARALAKIPSQRFANCCEFVDALAQAYSEEPTTRLAAAPVVAAQPMPPVTPVPAPAVPVRRPQPAMLAAAIALLGLGGALAVWKPWNRAPQPPDPVAAGTAAASATPVPTSEPAVAAPVAPLTPPPHDAKLPKTVSTPPKIMPSPVAPTPPKTSAQPEAVAQEAADPGGPADEVEPLPPSPPPLKSGAAPSPFEVAIHRAQEDMKIKDFAGAIQSYTKAISLHPKFAPAFYNRGLAQQNLQHPELAIKNYSDAIRLAPDMAPAYSARGVSLVRLHRDQEAFADFQKALELKPGLATALSGRGGVYFRRKQYRLALADYNAAIQSNPRFAPAYINRARAREAVGDLRGAAADRQREAELRQQ